MDRRAVEIATFLRLFQPRTGFRKPLRFYDKTLPARLLEEIQRHFQQLASPVQHQESGYRNFEADQMRTLEQSTVEGIPTSIDPSVFRLQTGGHVEKPAAFLQSVSCDRKWPRKLPRSTTWRCCSDA